MLNQRDRMRHRSMLSLIILFLVIIPMGPALADINIFLGDLNNQASINRNDYASRLSSQFGVPIYQVDSLLRSVQSPADAFMCLQLGRMLNIQPDRVLRTYQSNRGQGWGVTAQKLGIKPGSSEFHALKNGDFVFTGNPDSDHSKKSPGYDREQGKEKKSGKGHGHSGKQMSGYEQEFKIEKEQGKGQGSGKGGGKGNK